MVKAVLGYEVEEFNEVVKCLINGQEKPMAVLDRDPNGFSRVREAKEIEPGRYEIVGKTTHEVYPQYKNGEIIYFETV